MVNDLNDLTCFNCGVKISKGVICASCEVIENYMYDDTIERDDDDVETEKE